jgi:PAS domain S-box-containing protein
MINSKPHYLQKELYERIQMDPSIFEFIQSGSLDGIWYWDLENPENEWMSSRFWETLGYDPGGKKHLASEWQDLIHPEDLKVTLDNFKMHCADPEHPYDQVVRYLHKDGSTVWVRCRGIAIRDDTGKPIRMLGAHTDLTPQKRVEEALRESEERFRELFDSIADLIYTQDLDGRFLSANPALHNLFGYDYEEFLGRKASDFMKPELKPLFEKEYLEGLKKEGHYEGITGYFRKDGKRIYIEYRSKLVRPKKGSPYISGIGRDVTERILAEKERKRLQTQLQQAQRMEALGTLAGGIAHNFNNALMGIQGRASLMMIDKDPSHPDLEHLKGIEEYVQNAAELTKDLLGFARGGKYEVRPTNMNELIKHENRLFGQTKKEISMKGKYAKQLWTVEVDQGQMRQMLMNLYVNAWQAMPAGGMLYVQTENVTVDEAFAEPIGVSPGRYVKIAVTDTGTGMDEETREKIFDPFFTTQEMGTGTGLGLASVYGIVKNHGGFINVYSEKGEGTAFHIYLPASEQEILAEEKPSREIITGEGTVLLVDDEEMILDVGKQLLEKVGYRVMVAKHGKEALAVYEKNKKDIDLVILDMIMPGMGGGEVFDRLKEIEPDIKVLLSSGYSINGRAQEILDRGCDGFIQKPFNLKALSRKIREVMEASSLDSPIP